MNLVETTKTCNYQLAKGREKSCGTSRARGNKAGVLRKKV